MNGVGLVGVLTVCLCGVARVLGRVLARVFSLRFASHLLMAYAIEFVFEISLEELFFFLFLALECNLSWR